MLSTNNNKLQSILSQFGLNAKDGRAFLELIRLGGCPVSRWAEHAGINRSSMYVLLKRLKAKKLVFDFLHQGSLHVQAVPMAELPALLADKQQTIEQSRELLLRQLPQLQQLEKVQGLTPKISFYEGKAQVETMYEHVLKEHSFKSFFHPGRIKTIMPEYFHKIPQTLKASGGSAQELLISCPEADEYLKLYRSPKHQIAILPQEIAFSSDTIITDQKIFLVGYSATDVVATEIWSEEMAQTQAAIFDIVWLTKTKT